MHRFILFFIFGFTFIMSYAQRTAKVSATYTYYAPETMSVEEAKRTALDRAKIQAIADEFGTIVSQSTSTAITNQNGISDSNFFAIGRSEVKGDWIETLGEPKYSIEYQEQTLVVTCTVKGTISEFKQIAIDFDAHILCNGTNLKYERTDFKDGDDLYLLFTSPYAGYLTMYWVDWRQKTVSRILPYSHSEENLIAVKPNYEYLFFSKSDAHGYGTIADEYNLTCSQGVEHNELYICFSDKPFYVPAMTVDITGMRTISVPDFENWKSKVKHRFDNLLIKTYQITITSKQ